MLIKGAIGINSHTWLNLKIHSRDITKESEHMIFDYDRELYKMKVQQYFLLTLILAWNGTNDNIFIYVKGNTADAF